LKDESLSFQSVAPGDGSSCSGEVAEVVANALATAMDRSELRLPTLEEQLAVLIEHLGILVSCS